MEISNGVKRGNGQWAVIGVAGARPQGAKGKEITLGQQISSDPSWRSKPYLRKKTLSKPLRPARAVLAAQSKGKPHLASASTSTEFFYLARVGEPSRPSGFIRVLEDLELSGLT